jgi:hypothetical protein
LPVGERPAHGGERLPETADGAVGDPLWALDLGECRPHLSPSALALL